MAAHKERSVVRASKGLNGTLDIVEYVFSPRGIESIKTPINLSSVEIFTQSRTSFFPVQFESKTTISAATMAAEIPNKPLAARIDSESMNVLFTLNPSTESADASIEE